VTLPSDATPSPPRPSVADALKSVVTSRAGPWAGAAAAIVMALVGQWQASQASDDTARVSYDALKAASEANTAAIEAVRLSQIEQAAWIQKLSDRLELRQVASEKAIRKPKAAPLAPPKVEPAPPAPPPPVAPVPTRLLPFDSLKAAP
jgi:hypothetical protein